jgi:hypothetical protein
MGKAASGAILKGGARSGTMPCIGLSYAQTADAAALKQKQKEKTAAATAASPVNKSHRDTSMSRSGTSKPRMSRRETSSARGREGMCTQQLGQMMASFGAENPSMSTTATNAPASTTTISDLLAPPAAHG